MADNSNETPNLLKYKNKVKIEHKDFAIPLEKGAKYYFAFYDTKGTLGFKSNVIDVQEWLKDGSEMLYQIIEVVIVQVSNEYLHYWQEKRISYIFEGKNKIDIKTSLVKLKKIIWNW